MGGELIFADNLSADLILVKGVQLTCQVLVEEKYTFNLQLHSLGSSSFF